MPDYNPNSIWSSKEKKYEYDPPPSATPAKPAVEKKPAANMPPSSAGSPTKKIIIASVLGIVLLGFLGFMYYLLKPAPPQNVALSFLDTGQVLVGEPFPLTVHFVNNSQNVLENTSLSLTLPAGMSMVGQPSDRGQRVVQVQTGNLQPGATGSTTFQLILTGSPQSVAHASVQFSYGVSGSPSAQYGVKSTANILVGQAAVGLAINAPTSLFSGQTFNATIAYINNTGHALNDVRVQLQYPTGYALQRASGTQPMSPGGAVWDLGPLDVNASGTFTIVGTLVGQDNALSAIGASAIVTVQGQPYTITSPSANITLAASPLSLSISLNGSPNYVAQPGQTMSYTITYLNNSSTTFQNVQIKATLLGSMFDFKTLQSAAAFDSVSNTVTWYPANTPALASVAPGQSGTVSVSVNTKPSFPIRFFGDKNYTLRVHAQILSNTVPVGTTAGATVSVADLQNKVGGMVAFTAAGYYHDVKLPGMTAITNTGPYPPKLNQKTTYTIHWRITDYSTDLQNITVGATLQSGTTCGAISTSTMRLNVPSSTLTCNPANGQVSWQIPFIPATTGVVNSPAEAVFQIENTPAINQLGGAIVLIGPASLQATDVFTGQALAAHASTITTDLPDDTSLPNDRKVTQ